MTILTKPSNEKKTEKVPLPLADDVGALHSGNHLLGHPSAPDYDTESMAFHRPEFSCIKTILLFFIALIVMSIGVLGGYTLYRMYTPAHSQMHYRAFCDVPYYMMNNSTMPRFYVQPELEAVWRSLMPAAFTDGDMDSGSDADKFFREEIEFGMADDDSYTKIDVPDFKDGRRGRFMHDFKENQSAIIDTSAERCFIMPLDRETTLPPKTFLDLMQKLGSGYYNINTERVRRHMRVVMPPITDMTTISERIANECFDMKVYMLENYVSGVFKRSISLPEAGKFAEFSGKGIIEFDIMNIDAIEAHQQQTAK